MSNTVTLSAQKLGALYNHYNKSNTAIISLGSGENKVDVEVKRRLNDMEVANIVEAVCEQVFNEESEQFCPELKDYYVRMAVIASYTNVVLDEAADSWNLAYGTPLFAMITGHEHRPVAFCNHEYDENAIIDVEQYEHILKAIDQKIEYMTRQWLISYAYGGMADVVADITSEGIFERGSVFHAS